MADSGEGRFEEVFAGAAGLPAAERAAYLDRECAGDAALRARVVALLEAHGRAGGFMASPVTDVRRAPWPEGSFERPHEGAGSRIGAYRLLELLGEGGFGSVFLADQEHPVQRRVAFKIIKLGMDTRQVIARFEAERQALALMDHPNIAKVLDAGATDTGRPYFVMELVKGEPITQYADRNNLTIDERLSLVMQVCQAVQHAHTKGIIHRDIKPNNVLVTIADGKPFAKVIDFGIAKATQHRLTEKTLFTEHRALIGTPEYMSPEQAEGSLDIDTRTDVYSLGVLLYELLTGTTPFDGKTLRSAAYAEIQRIIREVEPPRPSTRLSQNTQSLASVAARRRIEPRRLGLVLRGELDWIVMKALDKDRARRYESASALALDIHRHLTGEAVQAAPPSAVYRVRKFVRRHRAAVGAASFVALALVLGIIGATAGMVVAVRERNAKEEARAAEALERSKAQVSERSARESEERARAEAVRAAKAEQAERTRAAELEQVVQFQSNMFTGLKVENMGLGLVRKFREEVRGSMERRREAPERIEEGLRALDALLSGINATNIAVASLEENILQRAEATIRQRFADQPLVRARLLHTVALMYQTFALYDRVEPLRREALEIHTGVLGPDDPETLLSMNRLARAYFFQARYADAARTMADLLERQRRVLGNEHKDTIGTMSDLSAVLFQAGRVDEAERPAREALDLRRRTEGPDSRGTLDAANNLGSVLMAQGKFAEAEPIAREALDGYRRTASEDHPHTINAVVNMGLLYLKLGRLDEAEPLLRDSLERYRRIFGDQHDQTIHVQNLLAGLLSERGRHAEAEQAYREVYQAYRRVVGAEDIRTLQAAGSLAAVIHDQGRPAEAEAYYRQAADGFKRQQGERGEDYLEVSVRLAAALGDLERLDEAEGIARDVSDVYTKKAPAETWRIWQCKGTLGSILFAEAQRSAETDAPAAIAKIREAAPLLLDGHQKLFLPGATEPGDLKSRGRIVELYALWDRLEPGRGYDAKAAEWRAKAPAGGH